MVQTIETLRRLLYDGTEEGKAEAVRLAKITPDPIARDYVRHHAPARMLGNGNGDGDGNGDGYGDGYGDGNGYGYGDGYGNGYGYGDGNGNGYGDGDGDGNGNGYGNGNGDGNGEWMPCKEDAMKPGIYIVKMERGLDYAAQVLEVDGEWVYFGLAVVLRKWGTTRGLGQLLTNATLGKYDPIPGAAIRLSYVQMWVPIPTSHHEAWLKRLRAVCEDGAT
jgi:hypothetical protein